MEVTPLGITIDVRLLQPLNADSLMDLMPSGIAMDFRLEQSKKRYSSIRVRLLERTADFKFEQ